MANWDERYSTQEYQYGTEPNSFLVAAASKIPTGGKVLCLGEGEGRNAVYLAEQGHQVLAIDSSAVGLQKAQRLATQRGVQIETCVADLADYQIEPESWDAVVAIFCHLPADLRAELHREIVPGLRCAGLMILEAYRPEQLQYGTGGPSMVELLLTLEMLQTELAGLKFLHAKELVREVIEGRLHTGAAAVVQLMAIKP